MNERDWMAGHKSAWTHMLLQCLKGLGVDDPLAQSAKWLIERNSAIVALRSVCEDHGDNDWPDDLNLRDIIDKHLQRHLEADEK